VWTFPVIFDVRPTFLPRAHTGSLLLSPLGDGTVLSHLRRRIGALTSMPPVIVTRFDILPAYEEAILEACPDLESVARLPDFAERLFRYEPSDRLLLTDPGCFPIDAEDPAFARFKEQDDDPRGVKHLVAIPRSGEGTKEYMDADSSGRIRSIQRYYDTVTWPFGGGIACSQVPVASLRVSFEPPLNSLSRLRRALSAEGVPSRDLPLEGGAVNLETERGLLAMNERLALSLSRGRPSNARGRTSLSSGPRVRLHSSVTVVGPVVLQDGVQVQEDVTLIGPTVVGRGSVVGKGATIAQCVIGSGQVVAPGATLRHSVYLGDGASSAGAADNSAPSSDTPSADPWETPPLQISGEPPSFSGYLRFKRVLEGTIAGTALLILAPLGLLVAALVKLESKGPIFFGHVREGLGGRPFRCWKLRTMFVGADQQQRKLLKLNQVDGPQFKVRHDPRRTRVGRVLTALNIDELPQLWNVLVGQMSLVGPRPSPFRENQVCVPWRQGRLSVRPGITGLWQICRHDRDKSDFHQWIYYDLLYVRNVSFWLDLKIVALTFVSFARGGCIPLSWLLPPQAYGERRSTRRQPERRSA
jgi:lipopolysaccharide/colanic/teichoic acid biosynthesis glycosyltransferase